MRSFSRKAIPPPPIWTKRTLAKWAIPTTVSQIITVHMYTWGCLGRNPVSTKLKLLVLHCFYASCGVRMPPAYSGVFPPLFSFCEGRHTEQSTGVSVMKATHVLLARRTVNLTTTGFPPFSTCLRLTRGRTAGAAFPPTWLRRKEFATYITDGTTQLMSDSLLHCFEPVDDTVGFLT